MEHLRTIGLLDSDGRPFHPRIERVLCQLVTRLRREFPALQDEVTVIEVMEEAGRRIRAVAYARTSPTDRGDGRGRRWRKTRIRAVPGPLAVPSIYANILI